MKLLVATFAAVALVLMAFPVVFAGGDTPGLEGSGCAPRDGAPPVSADMQAILATIRERESGGDYQARASGSTASGAYQFIDGTWAGYGGYPRAWLAPAEVQDAKATEHVQGILDANNGDVGAVPVVWYLGYLPAPGDPAWDRVPGAAAGNRLTPREYQARWMGAYERALAEQPAGTSSSAGDTTAPPPSCASGAAIPAGAVLEGGWAYPAAFELFGSAPVDNPHHDYPAWDWSIPEGTPIFAVRGGEVVSISTWAGNLFDQPCTSGQACSPCGIGVTIADETGTHWTYCHGSAVLVTVGDTINSGTQILASGNTGRSTGPHLHLAIRTSDGQQRCPQPLLRALRDHGAGVDPLDLPTSGCTY